LNHDAEILATQIDGIAHSLGTWIAGGIGHLKNRPESWGFAGNPTLQTLTMLHVALEGTSAKSPALLECGSGFGFVAALARELGFSVTGIEVVPEYIELSRRLFPAVRIVEDDLLTWDHFGDFDVVYYNGPFAHDQIQANFERRIETRLRPGGIILAVRKVDHTWQASGAFDLLWTDGALRWVLRKHPAVA
jgi:SAM-dependent methyltransferase